ncbi:MAG: zinc finger Ran-binding domain-containing family 2 protein [Flavobacteriales bacterium]|nr:zinc finger Ran-binding domain-containing family 2 protein [Flavobacteriales bacterium]
MRCNNCGYTNTPTALRCDRCNYPLGGSLNAGATPPPSSSPSADPARTMKGDLPSSDAWDRDNADPLGAGDDRRAPAQAPPPPRKAAPGKFDRTIDPSRTPVAAAAGLRLVRLPREGEEEQTIELPGESVSLERDNVDPGNMTITSKGQALLEHENGSWYITDTSALRTTYVRVAERTKLSSGDVILLGDRAFRLE